MSGSVAIIGAGAWGTAIAKLLGAKGREVSLWVHEKELTRNINEKHVNNIYLDGVVLPESVTATSDVAEAMRGKDVIFYATPSAYILELLKKSITVENIMEGQSLIAVLTKGFIMRDKKPQLIIKTLENYLPGFYKGNLVYVSGPSHAEEVAANTITGLICASSNPKNAITIRKLLASNTLSVHSSLDVVGVQVCAAIKNVIAIAFGILDALKEGSSIFGDNTESLLLAAGLNEIQILGNVLGSTHPETFTSVAGVGDLDVTCRSKYGRNRRFGRSIILEDILAPYSSLEQLQARIGDLGYLPEGVFACGAAKQLAEEFKLKTPIINSVYGILNKQISPHEAVRKMLAS